MGEERIHTAASATEIDAPAPTAVRRRMGDLARELKRAKPVPGYEIPAVFINRFHLEVSSERIRVTFGEQAGEADLVANHFVAMFGFEDAVAFANGIIRAVGKMVADKQVAIDAAKAS